MRRHTPTTSDILLPYVLRSVTWVVTFAACCIILRIFYWLEFVKSGR